VFDDVPVRQEEEEVEDEEAQAEEEETQDALQEEEMISFSGSVVRWSGKRWV